LNNTIQRILFTESSVNLDGQELQALQQMVALREAGIVTHLVCRKNSRIATQASQLGIAIDYIDFRNSLHLPSVMKMRSLIQTWQPDAIISHSGHDANISALSARLLAKRPVLIRSRTYQPGLAKAWTYNRLADMTIVPSAYLKQQILANPLIHPERIRVVYPGLDIAALYKDSLMALPANIANWLNERCSPASNHFVMVHAAMLRPEKGHLFMLQVVAQLIVQFPQLRYVIAGEGEEKIRIMHKVAELNLQQHVLMAGMVKPVAALLKRADIVIMPSFYEPLGMAQSEALALGTPVIASNTGGLPETVSHHRTGLLANAGDQQAWVSAIEWALTHRPQMQQMADIGHQDIQARFSIQANILGLLQVIQHARPLRGIEQFEN
jgi:glycosyltransferase involved in cell wall biosynthesis